MRIVSALVPVSLLTIAVVGASPAHATHVGLFLDAGPGFYTVSGADQVGDRSFLPLVGRFGVYADGVADGGVENVFEMDVGLIVGGVLNLVASAGANGEGQSLTQPAALDDPSVRLLPGHLFRFRGISAPGDLGVGGLRWGGNFDVDIGILEVAGAGIQVGGPYVSIGIGPTLAYIPNRRTRVFLSPNVGAHVGDTKDIFTGWSFTGQVDVFYTVVKRYLDVKGQLALDTRTWFPDKLPLGKGTIGGVTATVGLVGQLGWIFGIDEEDQGDDGEEASDWGADAGNKG